jgi:hypothetical protein
MSVMLKALPRATDYGLRRSDACSRGSHLIAKLPRNPEPRVDLHHVSAPGSQAMVAAVVNFDLDHDPRDLGH